MLVLLYQNSDSSCKTSLIRSGLSKPFNVASVWTVVIKTFQKTQKKCSVNKTQIGENLLHKFCCEEIRLLLTTTLTTRCHSLSLILPIFLLALIRWHSLSLVVTCCTIRCHLLLFVITRCITRLSFYKRLENSVKSKHNMQEILCKQLVESVCLKKVIVFYYRFQLCNSNDQNSLQFALRQAEEFFISVSLCIKPGIHEWGTECRELG